MSTPSCDLAARMRANGKAETASTDAKRVRISSVGRKLGHRPRTEKIDAREEETLENTEKWR